jgi:chemotaxis response regulator CheB
MRHQQPAAHAQVDGVSAIARRRLRYHRRREVRVAQQQRERHIAIVLGGMLDDGASKLRAVRAAGGTVLVQEPASCAFDDMPRAAIARGHSRPLLQLTRRDDLAIVVSGSAALRHVALRPPECRR